VTLLTLPPAFWKWRMRSASLTFLQKIKHLGAYDRVFATDMMNMADFAAMAGPDRPPLILYFHENQLSYPLSDRARQRRPDVDLGFINITSALAAAAGSAVRPCPAVFMGTDDPFLRPPAGHRPYPLKKNIDHLTNIFLDIKFIHDNILIK
jgi:hypothetical protein